MKSLGWIGLGHMGEPMAMNLLKAGYQLNVYNRSKQKEFNFTENGAKSYSSTEELAKNSDIIFLMLSDSNAVNDVLTKEFGVLKGITKDKIVINMSTISPSESLDFSKLIEEKGGIYLDCPVSGSVGAAITKQLIILASGIKNIVQEVSEYFNLLGRKTIYFGEVGKGSASKLSINLLLGIIGQGIAESILLAEKSGIQKDDFFELISSSGMNTPLFQAKKEMLRTENFPSAFMLELMSKDLDLASKEADKLNLSLPLAKESDKTYKKAKNNNKGKLDMASVYLELKNN